MGIVEFYLQNAPNLAVGWDGASLPVRVYEFARLSTQALGIGTNFGGFRVSLQIEELISKKEKSL